MKNKSFGEELNYLLKMKNPYDAKKRCFNDYNTSEARKLWEYYQTFISIKKQWKVP